MTGSELLLDTNAAIAWFRRDRDLGNLIGRGQELSLTIITIGELAFGARKSSNVAANLARLALYTKDFSVISPDLETADRYGLVRSHLIRRGRPIPANDVWIAALALQHNMPIVTRDAHFREVEGVEVLGW